MLEDIIRERRNKLAKLKAAGVDPYPASTKRTHAIGEVLTGFAKLLGTRRKIFLAGRVMGLRDMGNVMFLDLRDESEAIQAVLRKDNLPNFALLKSTLDRGDFVNVGGPLVLTKTKEKSIEAKTAAILAKTLRPLPDKWSGIEDTETRLRERYLDLLINPDVAAMFRKKSRFWESARRFLASAGFLEVEMSALELLPGGAEAEPFVTHHNALDTDFYLRISLELPLKKLLVGGYEKVFEIGRVFRNEGIDKEHLQDYTQLEFYWAYADYRGLMGFVEKMYKRIVKETCGALTTTWNGQKIAWGRPWPKVDYRTAFKKANDLDPVRATPEELRRRAETLGLDPESNAGRGRLIDLIYKKTVRPHLVQPCLLINHPVVISPLSKRSPEDPGVVERIQVLACGSELGNGWSELNDPIDQRERFEEQMKLREAGDKEAQFLDEDFVTALEYGMPPAAGFGLSERLFSVLMDKPIRETVFFPLMRQSVSNPSLALISSLSYQGVENTVDAGTRGFHAASISFNVQNSPVKLTELEFVVEGSIRPWIDLKLPILKVDGRQISDGLIRQGDKKVFFDMKVDPPTISMGPHRVDIYVDVLDAASKTMAWEITRLPEQSFVDTTYNWFISSKKVLGKPTWVEIRKSTYKRS